MASAHHVLIVEDDRVTRTTLAGYFETQGFRVSEAQDGRQMRRIFEGGGIDLVLLDLNLPGEDGLSLLRELRRGSDVGAILVTGRTDEVDRIVGLEVGADDYVTKPFNARELLARSRNLLRRTLRIRELEQRVNETGSAALRFAGWTLDLGARRLTSADGEDVNLTRGEFELLAAFARHPGRVRSRDSLLNSVSHRDWAPNDRTIDVLVGRLRRKIEQDPSDPRLIVTLHGVGYLFAAEAD